MPKTIRLCCHANHKLTHHFTCTNLVSYLNEPTNLFVRDTEISSRFHKLFMTTTTTNRKWENLDSSVEWNLKKKRTYDFIIKYMRQPKYCARSFMYCNAILCIQSVHYTTVYIYAVYVEQGNHGCIMGIKNCIFQRARQFILCNNSMYLCSGVCSLRHKYGFLSSFYSDFNEALKVKSHT